VSPRTYYPVGHPKHQVRTHTKHNHGGRVLTKWRRGQFVAWDTEGALVGKLHRTIYGALATSLGPIEPDFRRPEGATSRELLDWLVSGLALFPKAIHIGFAFSYDVSMMLRDIPLAKARELFLYGYVTVDFSGALYSIQYQPRKCFTVRRWERGKGWGPGGRIWDVFGYFQSSFVTACERWDVLQQDALASIEAMKLQRATFDSSNMAAIARYCQAECVALAKLAEQLHAAVVAAELKPKRYDGPGALASALLEREGVKAHLPVKALSYEVLDAARGAYYGGRIECARFGHTTEPVYRYDLVSAYPWACTFLPSLAFGRWRHNAEEPNDGTFPALAEHGFARVVWNFADETDHGTLGATLGQLYPFAWRDPMDGNVYFPQRGHAWTTFDELRAAYWAIYRGWLRGSVEIKETWAFVPDEWPSRPLPFLWLPRIFALRAEWKHNHNPAEKVLKLALNSLYGKLAQRHSQKRRGEDPAQPRWHCLPWASWVTGRVRARLYEAAMIAGDALLMIATDAIFTTRSQPLVIGHGLGDWEKTVAHGGATIVQSGVYWLDADEEAKRFTRGFDPDSITRDQVLDGWRNSLEKLPVTDRRFIGLRQAASGSWSKRCSWQDDHSGARDLQLAPHLGKRWLGPDGAGYFGRRSGRIQPELGMIATYARQPVFCDALELSASLDYPWLTTESGEPRNPQWIYDEQDDAEL
jgi:DNA polymerase type B, organellar and viral